MPIIDKKVLREEAINRLSKRVGIPVDGLYRAMPAFDNVVEILIEVIIESIAALVESNETSSSPD